jgi:AcrR family transcriptional regulator
MGKAAKIEAIEGISGKREQILEVACRLFSARGYAATSVQDVVEQADCTKPTLYYYFTNKEALYRECVAHALTRLEAVTERGFQKPGSVRYKLHEALGTYLAHILEDDTELRLLMLAESHPDVGQPNIDFRSFERQQLERHRRIFEMGIASGELRSDLDVDETILLLFGMVDHRLRLYLHGHPLPNDYPDLVLDVFLNGVSK